MQKFNNIKTPVIVALDYPSRESAMAFVDRVTPQTCRLKVGKELFVAEGPGFVRELVRRGFCVFLDLKFHDIPNTVASACRVAADLGVWMINVHGLGGTKMLQAARAAIPVGGDSPLLIGVTLLTSMDADEVRGIGLPGTPVDNVSRLARLCRDSGLDGLVCSAQEAPTLRSEFGQDFLLVTPGIRPAGSASGDQARVMTPSAAIAAGSNFLVIGRPVTQADDPLSVLLTIQRELG